MLPMEGMPRRLLPAFPTRLTTWLDCRRRYRFAYLDPRPKAGPWAHYSVGSSVHEALRRWWDVPAAERNRATAQELVRRHWVDQGFRDREQSMRALARAQGWVVAYLRERAGEPEPVGVERVVGTVTPVLSVRGRVDRIDERVDDDGRRVLVVVDYKTSRRPSTQDDARSSLQLAMYSAAVERTLRAPCTAVELHHVPTNTVARWDYREGQRERHLARADELGLEINGIEAAWNEAGGVASISSDHADRLFPPEPSSSCAWCDFRSSCDEGRAASTPVASWAALERPEDGASTKE
jgi:RecB family exonuclease